MLKQRIEILHTSGVIGDDVAEFTHRVIDILSADYPQIGMDPAAMFITHLAMAAERIKKGEIVEGLDPELFREVETCPEYRQALRFRDRLLSFCPVVFPESECQFLTMHICNMLQDNPGSL